MELSSMLELLMPESLPLLHPEQTLQVFHLEEGKQLVPQGQQQVKDLLFQLMELQDPAFSEKVLFHPIDKQGQPTSTETSMARAYCNPTVLPDESIKQIRALLSEKLDLELMEQTDAILTQEESVEFYRGFISALDWAFNTINILTEMEQSSTRIES